MARNVAAAAKSSDPGCADGTTLDDGPHILQLYESDEFLVEALARYVGSGLAAGQTVIVIGTDSHREAVERLLSDRGIDLATARRNGRYVTLDAAETLSDILVDGWPHDARFADVVGKLVAQASNRGSTRVRAFGEMVGLLWARGDREAAIRLEQLWSEFGRATPLTMLCGYPLSAFDANDEASFDRVCNAHSHTIPSESHSVSTWSDDRLHLLGRLRNRATLDHGGTPRPETEADLWREHAEMADFFENAALPMHFVGVDGVILRANRAELAMLGYAAADYVGRPITDFHVDADAADDILRRLMRGDTLRSYEARLRCRDGSIKDVLLDSNGLWRGGRFMHSRCITRDVTAIKHALDMQRHLAAVVESSDDAIVGKTLDGIITSWNNGAERILGYRAEEMVGQSITQIIPPDRAEDLTAILSAIRRGERVDHFETERIRKDGRRIHVSLTVSPIRDAAGRIIGASKIARDVTERKMAEAERERLLVAAEQARAAAEIANRTKDDFLSVVSHELRTPLASILGWVSVLKAQASPEQAARAVATIERSGKIQAKLIEDLLDVSRIVSGRMRLDFRLVDLPAIMREALESIRPTADAKGVVVHSEIDASAGPVAGDTDRLHQVAWNLLTNAVKFTPAGGSVEVRLTRRDDDVQLVVRDTGCGIGPEFLPFVFERFRQAEAVTSRRTGGLGLGLAIVRHLVELHGGEVRVESDGAGCGATFTITLPFVRLHNESRDTAALPQRLASRRVLLVEDHAESRMGLEAIFAAHGAEVVAVATIEEARRALQTQLPDVLVSDIGLPDGDGYGLLEEVRALPALSRLPAIAITGDRDHDERRTTSAGYQVRMVKPVDPELLVTSITQLTARPERFR
jgi:PAS domain S-box-containing protein